MSIDAKRVFARRALGWSVAEIAAEEGVTASRIYQVMNEHVEEIRAQREKEDAFKGVQRRCGWSTKAVGARIAARREPVL